MKVIGITGGVGCGKTQILSYIKNKYKCEVILSDEVAHMVKEPGQCCYERLVSLLGQEVLDTDGRIHRGKMAEKIFRDELLLKQVNALIHPAVKSYNLNAIEKARKEGILDFLFIEAALLIEDGYEQIVDELWYIYATEEVRRKRLKESRGYSDDKISDILKRQLTEEAYREHCRVIIDNSGSLEDTHRQIDRELEEYL